MYMHDANTFFDKPPLYRSFLITMWQERSQDTDVSVVWRFRMEDPHTGQRRGFADLEALMAALQQEMDNNTIDEPGGNKSDKSRRQPDEG